MTLQIERLHACTRLHATSFNRATVAAIAAQKGESVHASIRAQIDACTVAQPYIGVQVQPSSVAGALATPEMGVC